MHLFFCGVFFWCSFNEMPQKPKKDPLQEGCDVRQLNQYILFLFGSLHLRNVQLAWILVWFPLPQLGLRKL